MQIVHQFTNQETPRLYFEREQCKMFPPSRLGSQSLFLLEHCSLLITSSFHSSAPTPTHLTMTISLQANPPSSQSMAGHFYILLLPTGRTLLALIPSPDIHTLPSWHFWCSTFDVMVPYIHVFLVSLKSVVVYHFAVVGPVFWALIWTQANTKYINECLIGIYKDVITYHIKALCHSPKTKIEC